MVTVYGQPNCIKCKRTVTNLKGIDFEYKDISVDPAAYARVQELGYQTLPVIEANGLSWSGYNREKLDSLR